MDKVLVTGSAGLVGFRVAELLHEAGVDVLGVDLRPSDGPFRSTVADVANLGAMQKLLEGRPNVVHAGAVSGPMLMLDDPIGIGTANVGGAMVVFEACRRAKARRLVWLSSIAIYGNQPNLDPVAETAPASPRSFYGHTKCAGEWLLRGYVAHYGLAGVALRLSTVFGPRRQTQCNLRDMIQAGLRDEALYVPADGSTYRQYVHADDAAEAVRCALATEVLSDVVYNVTGGTWTSEATIAAMLAEFIPGLVVRHGPASQTEGHIGPLLIDAAAQDLGYRPRVGLRDGLRELVAFYRAQVASPVT